MFPKGLSVLPFEFRTISDLTTQKHIYSTLFMSLEVICM